MKSFTSYLAIGLLAVTFTSSAYASNKDSTKDWHAAKSLSKYTNCDKNGKPKDPNLTIAFSQVTLAVPWRVAETQNFKHWAKKLCIPHFIWNQANNSSSKQLDQVSNMLSRNPDVLILDPLATKPLSPAVKMAADSNVPLVVVDRSVTQKPGTATYQTFVGADQWIIGNASAKLWIKKLKKKQNTDQPKGNLAIIMGGVGEQPAIARNKGVKDAIKKYPGLKIVAKQSGNWQRPGGRKVMQAYIQRFNKGELQGVFAASDEMMIGAKQALKAANRHDLDGWFFSGDGQLEGLKEVISGFDVADTQNPPFYGKPGLKAAIAIAQGESPAQYYKLNNRTFTCMTKEKCQQVKNYAAKTQMQGGRF